VPTPDDDVTASDILARIENSPHAELLHDEGALERTLIELMAASDHPVLAEMGRELQQGHISWQGLGTIAAYREILDAGFVTMQQIDLAEVAAGLDAEVAAASPAAPDTRSQEEEPDELFRGLEHENGR
jgi:multidrug efflux pump subunit AcrA (membrane-fusion protein)